MEEHEKRAKTEKFLDRLIKEWERLFSCQSSGVGNYCFDRGRWMELKKARKLINDLKDEKKEMRKEHLDDTKELRLEIMRLKRIQKQFN